MNSKYRLIDGDKHLDITEDADDPVEALTRHYAAREEPRPTVPTVTVGKRGNGHEVLLHRAGREPLAVETRQSKVLCEALAAELRGALADAYHAGRLYEQEPRT